MLNLYTWVISGLQLRFVIKLSVLGLSNRFYVNLINGICFYAVSFTIIYMNIHKMFYYVFYIY